MKPWLKTLIHSERLGVRDLTKVHDGIALATTLCFATLCKARIVVAAMLVGAGFLAATSHSAAADTINIINANVAGFISVELGDPPAR